MNTLKVALANKYDIESEVLPFENCLASRKLDGVRCLVFINEGEVKFYSRNGKEFTTLDNLIPPILYHFHFKDKPVILDGEITLDRTDEDDFIGIVSLIKRKNYTIDCPCFHIFDMITLDEYNGKKERTFEERYNYLKKIEMDSVFNSKPSLKIIEQVKIVDARHIRKIFKMSKQNNWEGIMLRNGSSPYEGKRTKNLLKIKSMKSKEFKCIDVLPGEGRLLGTLGSILVQIDKDNVIQVGSGFTDDQRSYFWKNPKNIIGKKVTVQYFQKSQNMKGKKSLRFPVFVSVRNYE